MDYVNSLRRPRNARHTRISALPDASQLRNARHTRISALPDDWRHRNARHTRISALPDARRPRNARDTRISALPDAWRPRNARHTRISALPDASQHRNARGAGGSWQPLHFTSTPRSCRPARPASSLPRTSAHACCGDGRSAPALVPGWVRPPESARARVHNTSRACACSTPPRSTTPPARACPTRPLPAGRRVYSTITQMSYSACVHTAGAKPRKL